MMTARSAWKAFPLLVMATVAFPIVSANLQCRLSFPASTSALVFRFGWPVAYLEGYAPGSGILEGTGPNRVWGHPEFNSDRARMDRYRRNLPGYPSTGPGDMAPYGTFSLPAAIADAAIGLALVGLSYLIFQNQFWIMLSRIRS